MNLDQVTEVRMDQLRKEMAEKFGEDVAGIANVALSSAMHTIAYNSRLNDVDALDCLKAFVETIKIIDRLADEHAVTLKNVKNN